jgi:uncharacterized membrane protein
MNIIVILLLISITVIVIFLYTLKKIIDAEDKYRKEHDE